MALISVPFTTLYLVSHAAGGAILHYSGAYVGGTYISAPIISAFSNAATTLSMMAGTISAAATSPVAVGVAVTGAVVGGLVYFFGVPAPIQAALAKAGLVAPAKGGWAVPIAKLAAALVLMALAGILAVNIYKRVGQARRAQPAPIEPESAREAVEAALGASAWKTYGNAIWLGASDTLDQIGAWASKGGNLARNAGEAVAYYATSSRPKFTFSAGRFSSMLRKYFRKNRPA